MIKFNSKIIIIFVLFTLSFCNAKEIKSTTEGGKWSDINTWVTKEIPSKDDDVVINGHVTIETESECQNVIVGKDGTLEISDKIKSGNLLTIFYNLKLDGYLNVNENSEISVKGSISQPPQQNHIKNLGIITVGN